MGYGLNGQKTPNGPKTFADLEVFFPYDYIYKEQYSYMVELKRALDAKGDGLLEMPTGTGKTITLLALITSYQLAHPECGKLIYCTRTVPEISKVVKELERLVEYRRSELRADAEKAGMSEEGVVSSGRKGDILAVCLTSRRNLCIHPDIVGEGDRERVDALCRERTASWIRSKAEGGEDVELCDFFEEYSRSASDAELNGVFGIEELKALGKRRRWCPYFLARHAITVANVVVFNYQYMLDPKIASLVSRDMEDKSIVVFDEAHNIDNVCIEALSVNLDRRLIEASARNLTRLGDEVARVKQADASRLRAEYERLVQSLATTGVEDAHAGGRGGGGISSGSGPPPQSSISSGSGPPPQNSISSGSGPPPQSGISSGGGAASSSSSGPPPQNISSGGGPPPQNISSGPQNADVSSAVRAVAASAMAAAGIGGGEELSGPPVLPDAVLEEAMPGNIRNAELFVRFMRHIVRFLRRRIQVRQVESIAPQRFLEDLKAELAVDMRPLRFAYKRLDSLIKTLEITQVDELLPIQMVTDFVTILTTYPEGFMVVLEPYDSRTPHIPDPLMQLTCLDASIAVRPVFRKYRSVILTSGTLSPLDMYPKMLNFHPVVSASFEMSIARPCIAPMIVTKGADQTPLTTRFEVRGDKSVMRSYGAMLIKLCSVVPDGAVVFFPSYSYMEEIVTFWHEEGFLGRLEHHKLLFIETKDIMETTLSIGNFHRACDCGRGAVYFSVARGKVAEGIDFDRHYGRLVVLIGIPYQYTLSHVLRARLAYLRDTFRIREQDFLTFDALRQSSQCIGRVIRSKRDYGIMVFADARYARYDKRSKLPQWVSQFLPDEHTSLTPDMASSVSRRFLKLMAQPQDPKASLGTSLLDLSHLQALSQESSARQSAAAIAPAPSTAAARSEIEQAAAAQAQIAPTASSTDHRPSSAAATPEPDLQGPTDEDLLALQAIVEDDEHPKDAFDPMQALGIHAAQDTNDDLVDLDLMAGIAGFLEPPTSSRPRNA